MNIYGEKIYYMQHLYSYFELFTCCVSAELPPTCAERCHLHIKWCITILEVTRQFQRP